MAKTQDFCAWANEVIDKEVTAIDNLHQCIDDDFAAACTLLLQCKGRIVVLGLGKSGHIGNKIAATFASTGRFFCACSEASHGDFGMITANDVVLAISNSGKLMRF